MLANGNTTNANHITGETNCYHVYIAFFFTPFRFFLIKEDKENKTKRPPTMLYIECKISYVFRLFSLSIFCTQSQLNFESQLCFNINSID